MNSLNDAKYFMSKTVQMGVHEAINAIKCSLDRMGFILITEIEQKGAIDHTYQIASKIHRLVYDFNTQTRLKTSSNGLGIPPCNIIIDRLDDHHSTINIVDPRIYMDTDQLKTFAESISGLCTALNKTLDNIEIGVPNEESFYQ